MHAAARHCMQPAQGCPAHPCMRLLPPGTPLQNNLGELHCLLAALYPDVFTTAEPFATAFDLAHGKVGGRTEERAARGRQG